MQDKTGPRRSHVRPLAEERLALHAPATPPRRPVSVKLRWDQCCESHGCTKPARFGVLCTTCFNAATPARRAVELHAPAPSAALVAAADRVVDEEGAAWLSELWAA